jgi:hypothetical protein
MNLLSINKNNINTLNNIADFSQLAIVLEDIDCIEKDKKIPTINLLLEKLRQDGELVVKIIDYSKIIDALCKDTIDVETGLKLLQTIEFYTEPMTIINFIVSLEPKIVLYKMIEENFKIALTLKKINY